MHSLTSPGPFEQHKAASRSHAAGQGSPPPPPPPHAPAITKLTAPKINQPPRSNPGPIMIAPCIARPPSTPGPRMRLLSVAVRCERNSRSAETRELLSWVARSPTALSLDLAPPCLRCASLVLPPCRPPSLRRARPTSACTELAMMRGSACYQKLLEADLPDIPPAAIRTRSGVSRHSPSVADDRAPSG